jgi:hypothetical protein
MNENSQSPVVLADYLTDTEAALLVAHLESLGIKALTNGSGGATGWPEMATYTQVVVRQSDLERAQIATAEFKEAGAKEAGASDGESA